jgi:hypothetical protein
MCSLTFRCDYTAHRTFMSIVSDITSWGEETEQYGAQLLADEGYLDDVSGLIIGEPTSNIAYYAHKGL